MHSAEPAATLGEDGYTRRRADGINSRELVYCVRTTRINSSVISECILELNKPFDFGNRRHRCEPGVPTPQISPSRGRTRDPV